MRSNIELKFEVLALIEDAVSTADALLDETESIRDMRNLLSETFEAIDVIDAKELSIVSLKLSRYMFALGKLCDLHNLQHNASYTYRKLKKSAVYNGLRAEINADFKVADAQADSDLLVQDKYYDELKASYISDRVHTFYKDMDRLIFNIGNLIGVLKAERYSEGKLNQ